MYNKTDVLLPLGNGGFKSIVGLCQLLFELIELVFLLVEIVVCPPIIRTFYRPVIE